MLSPPRPAALMTHEDMERIGLLLAMGAAFLAVIFIVLLGGEIQP